MEYVRVQSIEDPLFKKLHDLMKVVFPPEEVLEFSLWKKPIEDPSIFVYVAVHEGEVVGITEYRYYSDWNIAMTDFTIVSKPGLGLGRFLASNRMNHLTELAKANGKQLLGMFAEIYDPYQKDDFDFGGVVTMNPFVRREVLAHMGYKRLDFSYVHPSWENDGVAVTGLDLCFMPISEDVNELDAKLVVDFLTTYYSALGNKPGEWIQMIEVLKTNDKINLKPL